MKIASYLITIVISFILLWTSCKKEEEKPAGTGYKVNIGLLLPLSGSGSSTGESMEAALNLAYQDINNYLTTLGSEWRFNLIFEDTGTDTLVAFQKLMDVQEQGVQVVLGPYSSASLNAMRQYSAEHSMMILSPSSVAPSLAIAGDNIFRLAPNDNNQGEAMTALLLSDSLEALVPIVRDDIFGTGLLEATTQHFVQHGGMVTDGVLYDTSTQDFSAALADLGARVHNVLQQHPADKTGVYLISFAEGTSILHLAAGDSVLQQVRWYGCSAFANDKTLPADTDAAVFAMSHNFICPVFGLDPSAKDKWQPLIGRIQNMIHREPEIYALTAYDGLWLLTLTYLSIGYYPDITTYKNAFVYEANDYFGVTGRTTLDTTGDRKYATYDFWAIGTVLNTYEWQIVATYDNMTGELVRR
jgi:branched-chain amino acid transport system substrate-binding protein